MIDDNAADARAGAREPDLIRTTRPSYLVSMRAPGGLPRRAARGLLCGSACLALGAASHVAAGGRLPGAGVLAVLFLALTLQGALLLGGRKRRFDVVVLALGATQFALHNAFHFLPAPGGGTHPGMPAGHGHGPQHHMTGASGDPGATHAMDAGMILAHAAATLGSALCVLYGERVLRRLGALLAPRVVLRSAPSLPCPPRSRPVPPVVVRIRFGALLARSRCRRGPPVAASA
ncbi:hypothetical protein GCM10010284_35520 [Streptomyces rubiginosohelvolus]|uniref:Integral membrane protein n=1 Tax=Streptomyces rubiginosohelvolus TaxID=67362 RepID=A0ABQ3C7K7_9ACTN|nr:hypothetical protein SSPNP10_27545 [Streptomyces sp. NP10]GGR99372.1 hypothetical protein GCM10010284_35520 [Streptomyces rubiginosohelvolus]GGZ69139.1 hypothetical protein GCM10010328_50230 [Streptomyces pluricolorescens]